MEAITLGVRIDSASCEREITALASTYLSRFGFENIVCSHLPRDASDLASGLLCNTRPNAWNEAYVEGGMVRTDPVLQELRRAPRALLWSEAVTRRRLSRAQRAVMGTARDFGMHDGFVVPVFDATGASGLVSLAGREIDRHPATRAKVAMTSVYLYNRLCALRFGSAVKPDLTQRETEILKWIVAGKSDWQIGKILHISAKTVNFHVENVKRKFGVATRIQAVVAAVRQGYMRM